MHVGIAIISRNRPEVLTQAIKQHQTFKPSPHRLRTNFSPIHTSERIIIDDCSDTAISIEGERIVRAETWQGVAGARNLALYALNRMCCDVLFIMDDDVFPKDPYWIDAFIDLHLSFPTQHIFQAIPRALEGEKIPFPRNTINTATGIEMRSVNASTGCFFSLTKHALLRLGGFDASFGKYGFEDADYMNRAKLIGFTGEHKNYTHPAIDQLLHICDVHGDFGDFKWPGRSVLHDTKEEIMKESSQKYLEAVANPVIFKPFF